MKIKSLKSIKILCMVFVLFFVSIGARCSDNQVRANIRDVVTASRQVAQALALQLPANDPRLVKVLSFRDAADRFLDSFNNANTNELKAQLIPLFADLLTAFRDALLPLIPLGGTTAIIIVTADTAMRFLANHFVNQISSYENLLKSEQAKQALIYKQQFVEFLGE